MKRLLLSIAAITLVTSLSAQCTADYDFGEANFGVSPDPEMGESFEIGEVGVAYEDVIHILVPTEAGDVDSTYAGLNATIDSLMLASVKITVDGSLVDLSTIGLNYACNNNGDSPDPCTMLGGEQYCAAISGTPTMGGEFPLQIDVIGYILVFGQPTPVPVSFDQYTLTITGTSAVEEIGTAKLELGQNTPNPFSGHTTIKYQSSRSGQVNFSVMNLLGEKVYEEALMARPGDNSIRFDANELKGGIYLYSIEMNGQTITKRMVINN